MKFNCGPTRKEKREAKEAWHKIFAFLPHRINSHDCRWFEYIERKGTIEWYHPGYAPPGLSVPRWVYTYREESK